MFGGGTFSGCVLVRCLIFLYYLFCVVQLNALHSELANQMADSMVFPLIQFREKDLTGRATQTHTHTHIGLNIFWVFYNFITKLTIKSWQKMRREGMAWTVVPSQWFMVRALTPKPPDLIITHYCHVITDNSFSVIMFSVLKQTAHSSKYQKPRAKHACQNKQHVTFSNSNSNFFKDVALFYIL